MTEPMTIQKTGLGSSQDHGAVWIFDLDNTLYPASCRAFDQVERRIRQFIQRALDLPPAPARDLQRRYSREFGTTMRGLMVEHDLDPDEYLDYVHNIDLTLIAPNPALSAVLERLKGRKIIFTNGSVRHAKNITSRLGIEHHFETIFDIAATDFQPKPDPHAYEILIARQGILPERAIFFDDIVRNLEPAAELGMTTVWVANLPGRLLSPTEQGYVHHVTDNLIAWLERIADGPAER